MSDGVYQNCNPYYHDLSIMCTEDILYNIFYINTDSLEYLGHINKGGLIRE